MAGRSGSAVNLRREPQHFGRDAGDTGHTVGVVVIERATQLGEAGDAIGEKRLVYMATSHKQVREPVEDRNVGARAVGEVHISDSGQLGATWIDHDQPGALADQPFEARTDDRMGLGGIGTDQQDAVGPVESVEGVRAARQAKGRNEAGC